MKEINQKLCFALTLLFVTSLFSGIASADQKEKLFVYNWSQYMDPGVIKLFEKKYNVKVVRNFYETNATMFAKLRAGGDRQYDVIFPSSYYVPRLIKTGLIQPLNKKLIPNIKNISPKFKNPKYDPGNKYTVPYQWGDTGIAYNAKKLPNAPHSWSLIFDSKANTAYPFSLMDAANVMFGSACIYLGESIDCPNDEIMKKAAKLIAKTKSRQNFNGFTGGTPSVRRLQRGIVDVAVTWNVAYAFFKRQDPESFKDLKFFVPKEGSAFWVDAIAIPAHAPHPELANKFINFILKPKMGARISNWATDGTPNKKSEQYLDDVVSNPPITPPKEVMDRLNLIPAIEGNRLKLQQQLWTYIKSQN